MLAIFTGPICPCSNVTRSRTHSSSAAAAAARARVLSFLPCPGTSSLHRLRVRTNAPPRAANSVATGWFIGKVVGGQNKISKKELEKIPRANFVVQYKRSETGKKKREKKGKQEDSSSQLRVLV